MRTNSNFPLLIENFFGRDMSDLFNTNAAAATMHHNVPAVNVVEHSNGFRIEVAAPGLKKDDFKLNLNHNNLTISAYRETQDEQKEENGFREKYTRREFSYASFQRTFMLPNSVDPENIRASYSDGVLTIEIPKREEARVKPARQIEIGG